MSDFLNYNMKRVKYMLTHYRKVEDLMNGVVQERLRLDSAFYKLAFGGKAILKHSLTQHRSEKLKHALRTR